MITCSICQTINPPQTPNCRSCGAPLSAPPPTPPATPPSATPWAGAANPPPVPSAAPSAGGRQFDLPADPQAIDPGRMPDPVAAQAEINDYYAEQRARRRVRALTWLVVMLVVAGGIGFFWFRNAQKKAEEQELAEFFLAFRKVDDKAIGDFWRCVVRATHIDVRLSADGRMVTEGLIKAFTLFPKTQPQRVKEQCMPLLDEAVAGYKQLKPPASVAAALEGVIAVIEQTKLRFNEYHAKMVQQSALAAAEQEILAAATALHSGEKNDIDKAAGYALVLQCAVAELPKLLKEITRGPDALPIAKHIYETCKADKAYAEQFRVKCYPKLAELAKKPERPAIYNQLKQKIAGSDQERSAIDDCFKRANRGSFTAEVNAIGDIWYQYRVARDQKLLKTIFAHGKSS